MDEKKKEEDAAKAEKSTAGKHARWRSRGRCGRDCSGRSGRRHRDWRALRCRNWRSEKADYKITTTKGEAAIGSAKKEGFQKKVSTTKKASRKARPKRTTARVATTKTAPKMATTKRPKRTSAKSRRTAPKAGRSQKRRS